MNVLQDGNSGICNCCADSPSKCQDEEVIKIYAGNSCASMRVLLKVWAQSLVKIYYCAVPHLGQCVTDIYIFPVWLFNVLSDVYSLFQKVLFALCALNALTTVVCLIAAALRYLQIFSTRRPCMVRVHTDKLILHCMHKAL